MQEEKEKCSDISAQIASKASSVSTSGQKMPESMINLREHIVHLVHGADEEQIVNMVKLLEASDATTPVATVGGQYPPGVDGSVLFPNAVVEIVAGEKPGEQFIIPIGGALPSLGIGLDDRSMPLQDSDDNEDYTQTEEVEMYTPRDGQGRGGRRVGVSAVPMSLESPATFVPRVIVKTKKHIGMVRKTVAGCHLFANMDDNEQEVIVNALAKDTFPAGRVILTQGVIPNPAKFYLLFEGICEVIKGGKHLASLAIGNTFGELEIMYNTECAATIRCVTPCILYSLDQESYRNIVYKVSMEKQAKYLKLVENVSFLESLTGYEKNTLAEALVTANYYAGDDIIKFGEKGNYMHIVVEGEVQVVGREKGKKVNVVILHPGDVFGELEFLFNHLTVADVVAATRKVQTAKISRKHFDMCVGISDELKQYVVRKGNYEFYLRGADQSVLKEIASLERRVKLVYDGDVPDLTISKLGEGGEVVISHVIDLPGGRKKPISFRYPLRPLQNSSLLVMGIREDATIVLWSDAMERVTNFPASEVVGQSLYTFMHSETEQNSLYGAINEANKFSGNIDEEYYKETKSYIYTIHRRDGLTRVRMKLSLVPPLVSHGKDVAEIFIAVGREDKIVPPQANTDYSTWLVEQIRMSISAPAIEGDNKLTQISNLLKKFENLQRNATNPSTTENVAIINVRQLIGQVVMDYAQDCVLNRNVVIQNFEKFLFEEIYCDAKLLPDCLGYAMSNWAAHLKDCQLRIDVCVVEDYGIELLKIAFSDDGPGIPKKVLDSLGLPSPQGDVHVPTICQVESALEQQGGRMTVVSEPGKSCVNFLIPFMPNEQEKDSPSGSISGSRSLRRNKMFTTLVVEDDPVHRNLMCAVLWERKHAVLPGYTWSDIDRLKDITDILFVDVSQSAMSDPSLMVDTISLLREKARTMAIILTGDAVDDDIKKAAVQAGFLTLIKPSTRIQTVQVLRRAEEKVGKLKAEKEKIEATRIAFNQNSRGAWKKGALLGKGSFGEVYEAIDVLTGGKMAVKYLRMSKETSPEVRQEVVNEIEVMCTLVHPNIIHYFFTEDDVENEYIKVVMEFASGGTLQDMMQRKGSLEYIEYVALLRDIVEGVAYIHGQRYVHRDLKTPNVLLDSTGKAKLGDFGTAKRIEEGELLYNMVGTLHYMSPEVLSAGEIIPDDPDGVVLQPGEDYDESHGTKVGYSFPADIWSLGCIALEMATNKPPFSHLGCMTSMATITNFITELQDVPDLSPLFDKPPEMIEFVSACLQPDPMKRATANSLLSYSIFQDATSELVMTAVKALKRAQLMSVLNAFVAFQNPTEIQAKKKKQEAKEKRKKAAFGGASDSDLGRQESNFFDTSESDDDEDEEKVDPKKQESDFFADSDEESPEEKDTPCSGGRSPTTEINIGKFEEKVTSPAAFDGPTINYCSLDSALQSTDTPYTETHYIGDKKHESGTPRSAIKERKTLNRVSIAPSNPSSSSSSVNSLKSSTVINHGSNTPIVNTESDKYVICLHDALMMLVDQVQNIDNSPPMEDALMAQYKKVKDSIPSESSFADSSSAIADDGKRGGDVIFRPNIEQLLQADTEIIRIIAKALSQAKR